jgi:hypothetical protein
MVMEKLKILKMYLWSLGLFALFWWVLGHWVYPDWYHHALGFEGYDDAFVKIIGTLTVLPVLGVFFTAANPLRNKDFVISLLVLSILMAATYVFLINTGQFPEGEYVNVALLVVNTIVLSFLYPWNLAKVSIVNEWKIKNG